MMYVEDVSIKKREINNIKIKIVPFITNFSGRLNKVKNVISKYETEQALAWIPVVHLWR